MELCHLNGQNNKLNNNNHLSKRVDSLNNGSF